jgi:predicted amidohydrolase
MPELRVAAFELPARWGEPERALADVETLFARGPAADVVLLPELCLTGYIAPSLEPPDLRPFAEPIGGPTTARLAEVARRHRVHLVAPLVEAAPAGAYVYNTMIALGPDGSIAASYRKRHPWYVEAWATRGEEPLTSFLASSARLTIAICFDLHFVARESAAELRAADVLLFPSAWVERSDSRPRHLTDLARRFQVAVINANWGHGSPHVHGQGGSFIVSAEGEILARAHHAPGPLRVDAIVR